MSRCPTRTMRASRSSSMTTGPARHGRTWRSSKSCSNAFTSRWERTEMAKRQSRGTRALLEEIGDLGSLDHATPAIQGAGTKVISIVLDRIRPDPAQPRRVLPEVIRAEFLAAHINARQALERWEDRKSTRLNSSHVRISYAVF